MKKLLSIAVFVIITFAVSAQQNTPDSLFRSGVLPSGVSYYIRHNAKPKAQADLYVITDVGAIQEEDDQQGLAHFLEHMAFNGTKNYPDKGIIEYLEKVGVKFGANLNASTSWDVTTYMIKDLPVVREGVIDSALLILHDWAHFITPQEAEIDKERGVIKEELRTRDNADWRSTIELIKALGRGTKYEERNLIGYLKDLEKFPPSALINFYERWYRPEYQAVIIVGDVDVDVVERKLKALMGDIPPSDEGAVQREKIFVPDNTEPIISIYTDPEMQQSSASVFIKRKAFHEVAKQEGYAPSQKRYMDIKSALIGQMQNERFSDIEMQSDAPFLGAYIYDGSVGVIPTLETTIYGVQSKDGELYTALSALYTEVERVRRHGYTAEELERARQNLLSSARRNYNNRGDRLNNSFVQKYIRNFRFKTPLYTAQEEWEADSVLLSAMTIDNINLDVRQITRYDNNVITINAPEKEGIRNITQSEILHLIDSIRSADILPLQNTTEQRPLIPAEHKLEGSKVIKTTSEPRADATVWSLANGIEVVVKPTKLKADEVVLRAYTHGGASVLSDEDYLLGQYLPTIMGYSGLSEFSATELGKQLSGKIASSSLYVRDYINGLSASSSVADVETMLQLIYLQFSAPRFSREDFEIFRTQMRAYLANSQSDPDYIASKRFREVAYNNSPRMRYIDSRDVDSMSFESLAPLHDRLFGNGADFRFIITGNVDMITLKPLVERYLGSLPTPRRSPLSYVDDRVAPVKGNVAESFTHPMQQPKVAVNILYSGKMKYSLKSSVVASFFNMALDNQYMESVREEKGGTYGVGARLSLQRIPQGRYTLNISFDTNTAQVAELLPLIEEEIVKIATDGVSTTQIAKSREFLLKDFKNQMERNVNLAGYIQALYTSGVDYFANYEKEVNSITSDDIKSLAKRILKDKNRVEVVMNPLE